MSEPAPTLKRIAPGLYETTDGLYRIVRTEKLFDGRRGGTYDGWELMVPDRWAGWVIDDTMPSNTLRQARGRLAARIGAAVIGAD